jgi:hypothetical protein
MADIENTPQPHNESWWLEIILALPLGIPGFFAGWGWKWAIASWIVSISLFIAQLIVFKRGFVIHAFLVAGIFATLAALIIHGIH